MNFRYVKFCKGSRRGLCEGRSEVVTSMKSALRQENDADNKPATLREAGKRFQYISMYHPGLRTGVLSFVKSAGSERSERYLRE